MQRYAFITVFVLATLLLAALGASISFVRSIRTLIAATPLLAFERSTAL